MARTCFDKAWDAHVIASADGEDVLQIDRLLIHESMGAGVLRDLVAQGRTVAAPAQVFSFVDHAVDTHPRASPGSPRKGWYEVGTQLIAESAATAREFGLHYIGAEDARQGIVHVAAPELGIALPGLTIVCPDSHTCTLGGLGALAWGIGASECLHAVATQTLVMPRPRTMRVVLDGALRPGVTAKDVVLFLAGALGADGCTGFAVEFAGSVVRGFDVEARMTLCNMAIEMAARYGFVAADEKTFAYLHGREYAPEGTSWDEAEAAWRSLATDDDAVFDREVTFDCSAVTPQVTWGISPQHVMPLSGEVPACEGIADDAQREWASRALSYQQITAGTSASSIAVDAAYIGSCTNARISDLREAARVLAGRKVASGVAAICVPGSSSVKRQAEAEGLDRIFIDAGFEWHDAGCGFCANGRNRFKGERIVSTTNRNFENRQGKGTRTHLASPATVAASAVAGHLCDAASLMERHGKV
ncbi:3-isopropylmalate dehydratase large subunit [Ramlibacter sp.]|uniref:3-isopropylmalate dehydratase large subunit n=1 Tax=Ramlibacter sp. TaxID=1917967 RepID=UPI003D1326F7